MRSFCLESSRRRLGRALMDVEEPERRSLTVLRKQTASGKRRNSWRVTMEDERSPRFFLFFFFHTPFFSASTHMCGRTCAWW